MKQPLKEFSLKVAAEIKAALATQQTEELIKTIKASGDDRAFEVVMSTSDEDRQGDELDQSKWELKYFTMNPVLLWAHNYSSFPIGVVTDITIEGNKAVATGKFAPAGVNPDADMACALYQAKVLRAVSPGYIQNDDGTRELLEVSFCPVPAGRYALSMRQVSELGMSTRDLVTKGFFYDDSPPERKAQHVGDACELEDGTQGTLADDDKNPGSLICVPSKSTKSEHMNDELNKNFKAEHERHQKAFAKAIDEFKGIDEFEKSIDGEQDQHLQNTMKAIDEGYELQDQKKSIDELKSAVETEHLTHVKACDKAIDEFKAALKPEDGDEENQKAIDEYTKAIGDELDRHEKAHMDLCEAEFGNEGDEKKSIEVRASVDDLTDDDLVKVMQKAGRAISAKNKQKIDAVIKTLEAHHEEHGKSTNDVIASLKELMGSPQDDEGEEQKPDEKSGAAPKPRSSTSGATAELETYLFTQRLVRQVKTASEGALRQINEKIKEARSSGR